MLRKNKNRLIVLIVLIIILIFYFIVRDATASTSIVLPINGITFSSPQTLEFSVSGQMPQNITNKSFVVTTFTVVSSKINYMTTSDDTTATGLALVNAAFIGQTPALSINSTTNSVIATLTLPKYFVANNITSAAISGTGTITIT
jgi:hypothetical protein